MIITTIVFFYSKAYIKRRRLPDAKKVMVSKVNSSNEMNQLTDDNYGKPKSVKENVVNLIKDSTRTCYIGQNRLYDENSKRVEKKAE